MQLVPTDNQEEKPSAAIKTTEFTLPEQEIQTTLSTFNKNSLHMQKTRASQAYSSIERDKNHEYLENSEYIDNNIIFLSI
ncbi:hypothetical protein B9Z19DRAFT_1121822 [Tuber borchii]|uniref:Uncharacterized protein n=1 Tax=Tuber borchii TaxID=42251 RepID=A0A2T7A201_TUBBO|nr:hypothetical protein B9Z19DRAFT_1121822 [Tuber borchii]